MDGARPDSVHVAQAASLILTSDAADLVGNLDGLKAHVNARYSDDDDYLMSLHVAALERVGRYTGWPMRTGEHEVIATWREVPDDLVLRLPGPVKLDTVLVGSNPRLLDRLPHDATVELNSRPVLPYGVRYTRSWSGLYSTVAWPSLLSLAVYRVAATAYLYREATIPGDAPVDRILQSTLGPFLPVVL